VRKRAASFFAYKDASREAALQATKSEKLRKEDKAASMR
jgi:hypothetical protein